MQGELIGTVFNYFDRVSVAAVELFGNLKLGDTIRIIGGDADFIEVVDSIQVEGKNIESAKAGDKVGIKLSEKAGKGYKIYKIA